MRSLTSRSMSRTCAGVSAALLKSKVSLSGPTKEPFCVASWLDDFVQRPVQQVRDGVVPLDGARGARRRCCNGDVLGPTRGRVARPSRKCSQVLPVFCVLVMRQNLPPSGDFAGVADLPAHLGVADGVVRG